MSSRSSVLCAALGALWFSACGARDDSSTQSADTLVPDATPVEQDSLVFTGERAYDLTGDGIAETLLVRATGSAHDWLDVRLVIRDARGDTLWFDRWNSRHYFQYLVRYDTMSAATVERVVREHLEALVAEPRFSLQPPPRVVAQDAMPEVRESVSYHLAELDWRNAAGLSTVDATPQSAYDRIDASRVSRDRVDVVVAELLMQPSFAYHAGGEVDYVIGWSVREHAFVRLYSCC